MAETRSGEPKPRPIIRIGLFLMSHSLLVSVVCCIAGVLALLLLPVLAKNTYISENALMPGSAIPMLSSSDISEAGRFVNKILSLYSGSSPSGLEVQQLIAHHISMLGLEASYHEFQPDTHSSSPLRFFASPDPQVVQHNLSCSSYGVNTVGIIRAPRGDGKEAIVLVTPYNSMEVTEGEALSLGIMHSVFSVLSQVTWLAKDIVWLAADTRHGEYAAVGAWLRDYHTPVFGDLQNVSEMCHENLFSVLKTNSHVEMKMCDTFRRAGTMAAALVVKVVDSSPKPAKDSLKIYAEACNGQMPNLDLINIVNYLAVNGQGLEVKVEKVESLRELIWLRYLGYLFNLVGKVARSLNPQWNLVMDTNEYVEGTSTLITSLYNQALGVPTGSHGAFRDYQVDAITMEISSQLSVRSKVRQNEFLMRSGRLVEGTIRSVNNLLEKFHQSFFLYLLTSANKFVSVGVYMIAFALLVAPLPVVAASLFSHGCQLNSITMEGEPTSRIANDTAAIYRSWKWVDAAKTIFLVHLWGALLILFPYFYSYFPEFSASVSLVLCGTFCLVSLLILQLMFGSSLCSIDKSLSREAKLAYLKSVTIAAAFTGLCLMSVINFATAEIGALLLVPMCLTTALVRCKSRAVGTSCQGIFNLSVLLLGFPPVAFFVVKGALEGFDSLTPDDFWNWVEPLWEWSSATYVYLCMVHLPCWVLCILILFHPC